MPLSERLLRERDALSDEKLERIVAGAGCCNIGPLEPPKSFYEEVTALFDRLFDP